MAQPDAQPYANDEYELESGYAIFEANLDFYKEQEQKSHEARKNIPHDWLYPTLKQFDLHDNDYLHETLRRAVNTPWETVKQPIPFLLTFPLFSEKFCRELIQEANHYDQWSSESHAYSHNDLRLADIFLEAPLIRQYNRFIVPIMQHFWRIAFYSAPLNNMVKYEASRHAIAPYKIHHDTSSATVLIALNEEFEGGGTLFPTYDNFVMKLPRGHACIFPSRITHPHAGVPITAGERYILTSLFF